jgi:hypothetical protein
MSKMLTTKKLGAQQSLLAMLLAGAVSVYGCTTDRTLGNGDPTDRPGVRTTPTSGMSTGSQSGTMPPPMTSSYSRPDALQPAAPRSIRRLPPDEAALIVADQQFQQSRFRVLGPSSPGAPGQGYVSGNLQTGQFVNPTIYTNPQLTVNSSISSPAGIAITSGTGTGTVATGTTIVGGITANANDLALGSPFVDSGAAVFLGTETRPVPSNIAPETGSGGLITTGAGNPIVTPTPSGSVQRNAAAPSGGVSSTAGVRALRNVPATGGTSTPNGLRVNTNANGQVTVTNQQQ